MQLRPREIGRNSLRPTYFYRVERRFAKLQLLNPTATSSIRFEVCIHNDGTATAKEVYVVVQTDEELNYHAGEDWSIRKNPQGQAAFAARRSLHPGEVSTLFEASLQRGFSNKPSQQEADGWGIVPHFDQLGLRFLMYADNSAPQAAAVEFTGEDIRYESPCATKPGVPAQARMGGTEGGQGGPAERRRGSQVQGFD